MLIHFVETKQSLKDEVLAIHCAKWLCVLGNENAKKVYNMPPSCFPSDAPNTTVSGQGRKRERAVVSSSMLHYNLVKRYCLSLN